MNREMFWKKVHYLMDQKLDPMDDESIQSYLIDNTDDLEELATLRSRLADLKTCLAPIPLKPTVPLKPIVQVSALAAGVMLMLIIGFLCTNQQDPPAPEFIVLDFSFQEKVTGEDEESVWIYKHGEQSFIEKRTIQLKNDKNDDGNLCFRHYKEEVRTTF